MILPTTKIHLNQLKNICEELTNEQLCEELSVLSESSIGGHIRHILEFYLCLLNFSSCGNVNYDNRKRNKELETNKAKCIATIDFILESLSKINIDFNLTLNVNYSITNNNELYQVQTTFFRELIYNIEHTVHHLALIKIGIKFLDYPIHLDENLGVAISTIRNNKNKEVCVQ